MTAWTTLSCAAVASVVFVLLPRNFGQDMFGPLASPSAGSAVGFNDEVVLGRSGEIEESQEVVMDVSLT
ncbi:transglutaminaseTgpA domain-containing protein, partial [Streptomyces galilaeus]|uniref:transglutaminaseTgpA domain-containing protein n=1 Tax=Streptomyces galilaeus TaxID=33899 RepID=UPI0038F60DE8